MSIDIPYIVVVILLIYFAIKSHKYNSDIYFKYSAVITFVFMACRACVVGADTYNYTLGFMEKKDIYNDVEPLYNVYTSILRVIWKSEFFFIAFNTLFSLSMIYILIKRYSFDKTLSVLLFFIFDVYQPYFVALRQILALSILLFGVYKLLEKRNWKIYVVCAVVAYFMHNSTLINSILFFGLYYVKLNSRKCSIYLIVLSGLFGIVLSSFNIADILNFYLSMNTGLTTDRLDNFIQSDQLNDLSKTQGYIWLLRNVWVGLFIYGFMDKDKLNHWFSKIYLLSILLFNLFYNVDMITRINLPFNMFSIILFTWAYGERYKSLIAKNPVLRFIPILLILYFLQFYIRQQIDCDLNLASRMHPYYFFWQDYHNHPSITRFY